MVGGSTRSEILLNKSSTASKYEVVFEHRIKTNPRAVSRNLAHIETISDEIITLQENSTYIKGGRMEID